MAGLPARSAARAATGPVGVCDTHNDSVGCRRGCTDPGAQRRARHVRPSSNGSLRDRQTWPGHLGCLPAPRRQARAQERERPAPARALAVAWFLGDAGILDEVALWVPDGIPAEMIGAHSQYRAAGAFRPAHRRGTCPRRFTCRPSAPCGTGAPRVGFMCRADGARIRPCSRSDIRSRAEPPKRLRGERSSVSCRTATGEKGPRRPSFRSRFPKAWEDRGVTQYRRYRLNESMAQRRRGFKVTFELDRGITGPVALGALSHFGFGLFEPA